MSHAPMQQAVLQQHYQQATLMSPPAFQQMTRQSPDASQHAQLQKSIQRKQELDTSTHTAPQQTQHMMPPAPMQKIAPTIQQNISQQSQQQLGFMRFPLCSFSVSFTLVTTTTTSSHTVCYIDKLISQQHSNLFALSTVNDWTLM